MQYAYLANGRVTKIENCLRNGKCYFLESLYPEEICKAFMELSPELESKVKPGWMHINGEFIEPSIGEYIPELNRYYFPEDVGVLYGLLQQKEQELQQAITDQDIAIIEAQQTVTELELLGLERGK